MRFHSFTDLHFQVMQEVTDAGGKSMLSSTVDQAFGRVPLSVIGYSSNRWLKYLDDYAAGGQPLLEFLMSEIPNSAATFMFHGTSNHTLGPCLLSLSVTSEIAHLNFRTTDWAGAGVLDLSLAWLVVKLTGKKVWLTSPSVRVTSWQLAGYKKLDLLKENKLTLAAKMIRESGPESQSFQRIKHRLESLAIPESIDEEEVISNFPRITPEDLAPYLKVSSRRLRSLIRDRFGRSIKGDTRASHSWSSYADPRLVELAKLLKVNLAQLPTIEEITKQRVSSRVKRKETD